MSSPTEIEMRYDSMTRDELIAEGERLRAAVRNARLTWAMACPCPCDACDTFYETLKLTSGDVSPNLSTTGE